MNSIFHLPHCLHQCRLLQKKTIISPVLALALAHEEIDIHIILLHHGMLAPQQVLRLRILRLNHYTQGQQDCLLYILKRPSL